jgi:transketolase
MFKQIETAELGKELRMVVVDTIKELMDENKRVIDLDDDFGSASGWTTLEGTNKERFFNMGIAEANMVGVAAGLSLTNYIPFIHTFGPFATRRVFDQMFISGGYAGNTINVYGSDPGFAAGPNGGTHTTWEDVALMRMVPNATICDAADEVQMEWIIRTFSHLQGVHYVRGNRKAVHKVYAPGSTFELGKGNLLQEGNDILLVAAGQLVYETLQLAKQLVQEGYSVAVIDMFTIKPLDKELLLAQSKDKKLIITIENHSINGGLGSAVAETLAENGCGIPLQRIGVNERFGQVGTPDFLQAEFGLTTDKIYEQIQPNLANLN